MAFVEQKRKTAAHHNRTISYSAHSYGCLYIGKKWLEATGNDDKKFAVFFTDADSRQVALKLTVKPMVNSYAGRKDKKFGSLQLKNKTLVAVMQEFGYPQKTNLDYKIQDGMVVLLNPNENKTA